MTPWKHFSVHALEQAYIRLGIDCYELTVYLATHEITKITFDKACEEFNILRWDKKKHSYYTFKHPTKDEPVLAIVSEGVVLTVMTKDLEGMELKPHRHGRFSTIRTLGGDTLEYRGT